MDNVIYAKDMAALAHCLEPKMPPQAALKHIDARLVNTGFVSIVYPLKMAVGYAAVAGHNQKIRDKKYSHAGEIKNGRVFQNK